MNNDDDDHEFNLVHSYTAGQISLFVLKNEQWWRWPWVQPCSLIHSQLLWTNSCAICVFIGAGTLDVYLLVSHMNIIDSKWQLSSGALLKRATWSHQRCPALWCCRTPCRTCPAAVDNGESKESTPCHTKNSSKSSRFAKTGTSPLPAEHCHSPNPRFVQRLASVTNTNLVISYDI